MESFRPKDQLSFLEGENVRATPTVLLRAQLVLSLLALKCEPFISYSKKVSWPVTKAGAMDKASADASIEAAAAGVSAGRLWASFDGSGKQTHLARA